MIKWHTSYQKDENKNVCLELEKKKKAETYYNFPESVYSKLNATKF